MNGDERLVYMANQIARNLATLGEAEAAAATADHIAKFWDPRMKAKIFANPIGLEPIAAAAIAMLRAGIEPPPQTGATRFNAVDEVGHSDAG